MKQRDRRTDRHRATAKTALTHSVLTCCAFYSFSSVYILYSTAVIWRKLYHSVASLGKWHSCSGRPTGAEVRELRG